MVTAYKKQFWLLISASSKEKRLNRGKTLLAEMKHDVNKVLIWSDKKIFTVEVVANMRNDRFYACKAGDLPERSRSHSCHQKTTSLMAWATIASIMSKSPLIIINAGIK